MAVFKDKNKTSDGRCWYFKVYKKDFNGNNKAYKSKRYLTKKEAQEEEALFIMKRDNPINKPFSLVARAYLEDLYKIRKESTVFSYENAYKNQIEPYLGHLNIADINISTINEWRSTVTNKGLKLEYLNKLHNIVNSIFNYAMKNFGLSFNPESVCGRFQQKKDEVINDEEKIRTISYNDFNELISVIDNLTWKTFFVFLYYTGMRKGEIQALSWKDIDFNENLITVNKTLSIKTKELYKITSTKNSLNRKVKMSDVLIKQLTEYKNEMMKFSDYSENWFVFGCSRFMPETTIARKKHLYFDVLNKDRNKKIHEITIHEFRHSHVSLLAEEYIKKCNSLHIEADMYKFFLMMSKRMGHTVDVMMKTYMHLVPSVQNEIVDILNNL